MQNNTKPSAQEQKTAFKVRDERKPGHHWADNELMDIYASKIGLDGYSVYMYLARYSGNRDGRCTKSQREIAAAFNTSHDTVARAIKKLMDYALVGRYDVAGKASVYVLLEVPKRNQTPYAHSGDTPTLTASTLTASPHTAETPTLTAETPTLTAYANKEVRLSQDFSQDLRGSAQGALLPLASESEKPAEPKDPREAGLFAAIRKTWPHGAVCDIDNRDAKAIRDYLKRKPAFPGAELEMCIVFRSLSEGENLTLPVRKWIGEVDKYQAGPLNKFGDPIYSPKEMQGLRSDARTILYGQQPEQLSLKPTQSPASVSLPPDLDQDARTLWTHVLLGLENIISRHSFDTWLKPTRGIGRRGNTFYVLVPNAEFTQLGEKYGDLIHAEFECVGVTDVCFMTSAELASHDWERQSA